MALPQAIGILVRLPDLCPTNQASGSRPARWLPLPSRVCRQRRTLCASRILAGGLRGRHIGVKLLFGAFDLTLDEFLHQAAGLAILVVLRGRSFMK